ncbi:MAG: bifunctional 5,10-methylenetetrahydrofolate dehydrogenase/5,10-methenyltetrahydrofolate cyclohydrolase [Candidatus Jorgensenbacteria bacterium]
MVIDGRKIADGIVVELKNKLSARREQKFLAVILVGEEPTMVSFVRQKEKIAKIIGVDFRLYKFPNEIENDELKEKAREIADLPDCGGLVLQLPLPAQINRDEMIGIIPPEKDVDNLTGKAPVLAPAVGVVETILKTINYKLKTKKAAVVGLGLLVGKPVSEWLKGKCSELQTLNSSGNLETLKQADIVVSGVGIAGLIKPAVLKNSAVVIDFGYDFKDGKTAGDFDASQPTTISYTPTPGGTGPILVAKLFENFYELTNLQKP